MSKKHEPKPIVRGRDAKTGKFIPIKVALRRKTSAIIDTMPRKPK